jgi:Lon protease-like protein
MHVPLFPLGSVLFPQAVLQLQIFEVRYLDMIGRCWRAGQPFGVTLLTHGAEVRQAGAADEAFHPVGTLAVIEDLSSPQAGLILIRCRGTSRFSIRASEKRKNGAWTAAVDVLPDDPEVPVPEHLLLTAQGLKKIYESLALSASATQLPGRHLWHFDDCAWVANRWCELLPLAPTVRQQLMALDNPLIRLELVTDLLRQSPMPGH